ncbi:MAG: GntR family transcriptional regulator [bacterium]|jgi:DNA-binding GntR family transcriptional regulator
MANKTRLPVDSGKNQNLLWHGTSSHGRLTLADRIYATLKKEIHSFVLVPGARFSEVETAERLGVSRTPLREALLHLRSEGYVDVESRLGWIVQPINFAAIEDLYDLRIILELASVDRLCSNKSRLSDMDELKNFWLVKESDRITDEQIVGEKDELFHTTLVAAAGNKEILKIHTDVTEKIRIVRRLDFTRHDRIQLTYAEHAKILRAILARKVDSAKLLLRTHIEASKTEVRNITLHAIHNVRPDLGQSISYR